MQETTTLNALVMRRARDLIADYGWPDHTDVDQRDPVNKPGWISIYVRLDAANIVHLLPLLCTGDVPAELQSAMTKIAGTPAQIILSGVRPGGRLSARAKTRAGCACRRETSPRLRRRVLSSPLSVAVARECAYYQGYLPVTQSGDAYVEMEYRLFLKRRAG